jgi:cytochrome c peroxidase
MKINHPSKALLFSRFILTACVISIPTLLLQNTVYSETSPSTNTSSPVTIDNLDQMVTLQGDIGPLPAIPVPADNPQNQDKIELGKMLFFDPRLSGDNKISCSTCHDPSKGFADGKARAIGFGGKELGRHSPTILNAGYNTAQFWDGRSPSLEDQATKPIEATGEMNLPRQVMAGRLVSIPAYKKRFRELFGEDPTLENVGKSIAAFERTIITPDAPFDRYARGDKQALTPQDKRGLILFMSKAACTQCHNGSNFTDNKFHVLGVPQKGPLAEDTGRYDVTKDEKDKGAFKTPSLRNIALTAPYAHDGAIETLDEVVEFYNQGGGSVPNKSPKLLKLHLTKQEKSDLVAFLKTLTGTQPVVSIPQLPKEN